MTHSTRATVIGVLAIVLWACLALFTVQTRGLPPFETLAVTFGIAAAAGLGVQTLRGRRALGEVRQDLAPWLTAFGGLFAYHALYFFALSAAPAPQASVIAYLWPLLMVLFATRLAGAERLRSRHLVGALLGLGGTVLVLDPGAGVAPGTTWRASAGYAAAFGCALVWSGYSVLNRRFAGVPSGMLVGVCGAVALAGAAAHVALESTVRPSPAQGVALLLLGLGPTGLAFFAWDHATKHGQPALLGALSYLAPLLSTLLLLATGQAAATPSLLLAAVLILLGAAVATGPGTRS